MKYWLIFCAVDFLLGLAAVICDRNYRWRNWHWLPGSGFVVYFRKWRWEGPWASAELPVSSKSKEG